MSIGGATYNEGGFSSSSEAVQWANTIWAMFGPKQGGSSVNRPFGDSVIDGFDFDLESNVQNMAPFANQLRSLMDAAGDKKYYLSAAPQCVYPDAADNEMLDGGVAFDFISVQFYNNFCGLQSFVGGQSTQSAFNFATWDNWAKTASKNKNVKVLIGAPGSSPSAGTGYVQSSQLSSVVQWAKQFPSFGGVMFWDASTVSSNGNYLGDVGSALGGSGTNNTPAPPATTLVTATRPTTAAAAPVPSQPTPVPQANVAVTSDQAPADRHRCSVGTVRWQWIYRPDHLPGSVYLCRGQPVVVVVPVIVSTETTSLSRRSRDLVRSPHMEPKRLLIFTSLSFIGAETSLGGLISENFWYTSPG